MNDNELDRLLDLWDAPLPPKSLRDGLRARFPRPEKRSFARPFRWALAILLAAFAFAIALTGAVAIAQSTGAPPDSPLFRILYDLYHSFAEAQQAREAKSIVAKIAASQPKVFVDGNLAAPLEFGPGVAMKLQIPGDGVYSITLYPIAARTADRQPSGWVAAGHMLGNVVEFRAGDKQVRIECDQAIAAGDRPVFVFHRP